MHGCGDTAERFERGDGALCFYIKEMTTGNAGFGGKPDNRHIFFNAEFFYFIDYGFYIFGHLRFWDVSHGNRTYKTSRVRRLLWI